MATDLFIPNPADTDFPFLDAWEVVQWVGEGGAAVTQTLDTTDSDHPLCMKVVSDTDGKGVYYTTEPVLPETKHAFEFSYKNAAGMELDYLVWDNTGSATIASGTLTETVWSYHYEEFDTPAGCVEIVIYLRAGTGAGTAFQIDSLSLFGNCLEEDPEEYLPNYPKIGTPKPTLNKTLRTDFGLVTVNFALSFIYLSPSGFDRLLDLHKTRKETYMDDQDVPTMVERGTLYTETQYDYTGIENPSATHVAYEDKSASEPAAQGDFESNEIETADYNVLDDDDGNSYQDGASTTGHYQYHKFEFDTSGEYSASAQIQSFEVTYKGASNDASASNQDGYTLYAWNVNAGNWVKLGATRVPTKETISRSFMKPEQAQMFVDTANDIISLLVQTNGVKGVGTALTLDSYYIEVTINKAKSNTIALLNRAHLSSGRVVHVKNLTDKLNLALGPDYRMGDDAESVIADGVYATLDGAATYFTGGNNLDAGVNDLFISGWMRRDGAPGAAEKLVSKWTAGGGDGYDVYLDSDGYLIGYIEDAGGSVTSTADGALTLIDGDWHHFAIRFDRSGNMSRYIDGVVTGTEDAISARNLTLNNAVPFVVGVHSNLAAFHFEGSLCHIRIQIGGTLVTPAKILWQYNHGRDYSTQGWTLDGTRAYWKFDDAAGAANADGDGMITDGSGGGIHLDAAGGTTTTYSTHSRALSADPSDVVEVKYDQYYRVISTGLSERRLPGESAEAPGRAVTLQLQGLAGM